MSWLWWCPMSMLQNTHIILQPVNNLVLKMKYPGKIRSTPWLLMPLLLASPAHQQLWYWIWRVDSPLSSMRLNWNYFIIPVLSNDRQCKYILCLYMIQYTKGLHLKWSATYWFLCFGLVYLLSVVPACDIPACDKRCHIGPVMTTALHYAAMPMSRPRINGVEVRQLEDGMHF